jgi:hypothetical protein
MKDEISKRTVGYITAALGLVAGLAWNDAITSLIQFAFPASSNTVLAKFIYAFAITIAVVVATVYLFKILNREEKRQ